MLSSVSATSWKSGDFQYWSIRESYTRGARSVFERQPSAFQVFADGHLELDDRSSQPCEQRRSDLFGFVVGRWDSLLSKYKVRFVNPDLLEGFAGLHLLTTCGRRIGIPDFEIWLPEDLKEIGPVLVLHEAVEHDLRKKGWKYQESHDAALKAERDEFEGTPIYDRARELLDDR